MQDAVFEVIEDDACRYGIEERKRALMADEPGRRVHPPHDRHDMWRKNDSTMMNACRIIASPVARSIHLPSRPKSTWTSYAASGNMRRPPRKSASS